MLQITSLDTTPSIGALLGSRGNTELISSINRTLGTNQFFGSSEDRFSSQHKAFISKFIEPIRQANVRVAQISNRLVNRDFIHPLLCEEDLRSIPPCMTIPILTFDPVYSLLKQGRIEGWGYTSDRLSSAKEQYDRLIVTNGAINYGIDKAQEDGSFAEKTEFWYGIDPELSLEERCDIEDTRDFVEKILRDTELDPTNLDELRG